METLLQNRHKPEFWRNLALFDVKIVLKYCPGAYILHTSKIVPSECSGTILLNRLKPYLDLFWPCSG